MLIPMTVREGSCSFNSGLLAVNLILMAISNGFSPRFPLGQLDVAQLEV